MHSIAVPEQIANAKLIEISDAEMVPIPGPKRTFHGNAPSPMLLAHILTVGQRYRSLGTSWILTSSVPLTL